MRIVGEIPHPVYKITLFSTEDRWTIQVANGPYQLRTTVVKVPGLETDDRIRAFVDEPFLLRCRDLFAGLHEATQSRFRDLSGPGNAG